MLVYISVFLELFELSEIRNPVRLFTRQLQWAMQQCKRVLNKEAPLEDIAQGQQSIQTARLQLRTPADDQGGAAQPAGDDVEVTEMDVVTTSTNTSDDYTHRGLQLQTMPVYVYIMFVRRVPRRGAAKVNDPRFFAYEEHYPLASTYIQEVSLHCMNVPTVDGFQCPTWEQDPEQNSLLKSLLFTPWLCRDPMSCGSCSRFQHMLSNCTCAAASSDGHGASQPVDTSSHKHTFERGWRLRCSEIHVLAARADIRRHLSRKKVVLADTTLFATLKEPQGAIKEGEEIKNVLRRYACRVLRRTMPFQATRTILAFSGCLCLWHEEQCTLAEFCAYIARDVISHIELAAEARIKKAASTITADAVDEDADSDLEINRKPTGDLVDIGGGIGDDVDDFAEDVGADEVSTYPLHDHHTAIHIAFQQGCLQSSRSKTRLSKADKDLQNLDDAYGPMLRRSFALSGGPSEDMAGMHFKDKFGDMLALQRQSISLAKKQLAGSNITIDDCGDSWLPGSAPQPADQEAEATLVPLPLAMQGPAAVAWKLLQDAECTEEQTDAVSLLALSLQKRSDARPDKTTHLLPVATPDNNHRAAWIGGGGVGKTHTLTKVVEPLGITFFGPNGYAAAAQANHAAQNLGPRGRTLHSANGLLMTDSLQTARLRLNPQTQKKMDRLAGETGIDVIDELGCVSGSLLHADALRKTYGRSLRFNLQTTEYMKPQETWGRMPAKLLCGDFYQLPPVPASASLLAPTTKQTYEHQQGRKILADIEYVVDFVQMKRFTDELLIQVLEAMRTPGGKKISDECWQAILNTKIKSGGSASQPTAWDPRLRAARHWYESAYEWRIVSYAMHTQTRLDAHDAGQILFYIPAVDRPAVRCDRKEFDAMRAEPNISTTAKFPGLLPVFVSMEMILTDSVLPPKYVRGTACVVVGLEPHPQEPAIEGRASIASDGCVVLRYLPKAVYVKIKGSKDVHLQSGSYADVDLEGVLAIPPQSRPWKFQPSTGSNTVPVTRSQIPLLPQKQCTLHGVQGKTADPGFIAHWTYPAKLSKVSIWLATYVSLSRPRCFNNLLSHGLPDRNIIESGPPEEITEAFDELFTAKIAATKIACAKARAELGWPARRHR